MDPGEVIFKTDEADYGPEYKAHLLEQYKLFVEMTDRTSARRQVANNFFLSINTALIAFASLVIGALSAMGAILWILLVMVLGLVLCHFWRQMILSFKHLNTAKFEVIHSLESRLPAGPYMTEWAFLHEGRELSQYVQFTRMEKLIPRLCAVLYIAMAVAIVLWVVISFATTGEFPAGFPPQIQFLSI